MDTTTDAPPRHDGRNARSRRTREAIVAACRALMRGGDFRPTAAATARAAGCSVRSVFQHYESLEALHREALDADMCEAIAGLLWQGKPSAEHFDFRAIHAAVFGRLPATAE